MDQKFLKRLISECPLTDFSQNGNVTERELQLDKYLEQFITFLYAIDDMASLFEKSHSTINEHILNIFEEGELEKESSVRKIGNSDFSIKPTNYYNYLCRL